MLLGRKPLPGKIARQLFQPQACLALEWGRSRQLAQPPKACLPHIHQVGRARTSNCAWVLNRSSWGGHSIVSRSKTLRVGQSFRYASLLERSKPEFGVKNGSSKTDGENLVKVFSWLQNCISTAHSLSLLCFLSRQIAKAQPTAWDSLSPESFSAMNAWHIPLRGISH